MSAGDPVKLRTYHSDEGLVAYARDGRAWRTRLQDGKPVPIGITEAWLWFEEQHL